MTEIEVLRKEICDILIQIREKNPQAEILEGLAVNVKLSLEEHEEIEKKIARLSELEKSTSVNA